MEDPIATFVEQGHQRLAEFAAGSLWLAPKTNGGRAQYEFVIDFTRLIEDLLDSMKDQGITVSDSLAPLLLECCTQMGRLAEKLGGQPQELNAAAIGSAKALAQRLGKFLEPAASVEKNEKAQGRYLRLVQTSTN